MNKKQANSLRVYIAGKVSPDSSLGTEHWRDKFCEYLSSITGQPIINLDPIGAAKNDDFDQTDSKAVYGRCCYMIAHADVVIVNLTDDISVGGSQEMLIAKYFNKPLIGLAPRGGKFHKKEKVLLGKTYHDFKDPFVAQTCDVVCETLEGVATELTRLHQYKPKSLTLISEATDYYTKSIYQTDHYMQKIDTTRDSTTS